MASYSGLDQDLAMIIETTDTAFENICQKLKKLEDRTCNSTYLQQGAAKIDEILSCQSHQLKETRQQIFEKKEEKMKTADQITKCNDAYKLASSAADSILAKVEVLQVNVAQENKKINTKQEELLKLNSKLKNDVELKEGKILQYATALGLKIHHAKDKTLVFTFKYIRTDDPHLPFSFHLRLENNGEYEVIECQPMVPDLKKLVMELNKTNNFKEFVHQMRKEFCVLAKK